LAGDGGVHPEGRRGTMITKPQYRRLMSEDAKTGNVTISALKADVDRQTAGKYIQAGEGPQALQAPHTWRTRPDPLEGCGRKSRRCCGWPRSWRPRRCSITLWGGRAAAWRASPADVLRAGAPVAGDRGSGTGGVFASAAAGRAAATGLDPCAGAAGEGPGRGTRSPVLPLRVALLELAMGDPCLSESFLSLVSGLQAALAQLGKCPVHLVTDNSSAATHELESLPDAPGIQRRLLGVVHALRPDALDDQRGLSSRAGRCRIGEPALEARLEQHLLLRGSRDFAAVEEYDRFVGESFGPPTPAPKAPGRGTGLHAALRRRAWPSTGNMSQWLVPEPDPGATPHVLGALRG